jgi:enoyl-CoA hydratase
MSEAPEILFAVEQGIAIVRLNRPKALNALTHGMVVAFDAKLKAWTTDPAVKALVIMGEGGRAFCAGGDIRKLYDEGLAGGRYPYDFYRDEYVLNARIKRFPKPYIAFLDGITMGGGVGVSVHGSHRIATENTLFAMPETGIGLFPDVGGSHFLSRCPGQVGQYLALTGERLKAADTIAAGICTSFVPSAKRDELIAALKAADWSGDATHVADDVIARFAADPGAPTLPAHRDVIDRCFAADSVEGVLAALDAEGSDFARAQAATIRTKSPTSLKLTFRQIREGGRRSMDDCMRMEWRMVNRVIKGHDFYEGTRAVVVDKDQKPKWKPATLAEVSDADIDAYFAPLPDGDLRYDWD